MWKYKSVQNRLQTTKQPDAARSDQIFKVNVEALAKEPRP